ncbi:AAA_28 domain-containing protein [Vibrio phage vB_VcorM_GR11A]|nr:AAA_28 domain-containing protein [Vibrio phage vB_VcorM_GR11A]
MPKLAGLLGAHCTGKTTLMQHLSELYDITMIPFSVSEVFKKHGIPTNEKLDFANRLNIQNTLLDAYEATLEYYLENHGSEHFIIDRTPLDFLAYTYADIVAGEELSDEESHSFSNYVKSCYALTEKYFTHITLIQPGVPLEDREGRGFMGIHYIDKINLMMIGSLTMLHPSAEVDVKVMPRDCIDFEERSHAMRRTLTELGFMD